MSLFPYCGLNVRCINGLFHVYVETCEALYGFALPPRDRLSRNNGCVFVLHLLVNCSLNLRKFRTCHLGNYGSRLRRFTAHRAPAYSTDLSILCRQFLQPTAVRTRTTFPWWSSWSFDCVVLGRLAKRHACITVSLALVDDVLSLAAVGGFPGRLDESHRAVCRRQVYMEIDTLVGGQACICIVAINGRKLLRWC